MRPLTLAAAAVGALAAAAGPASIAHAEPLIARSCNGTQLCSSWFTAPVTLDWTVSAGTPLEGCLDVTLTRDTPGSLHGCIATDGGETLERTVTLRLDQTPPDVTDAVPDRPPDHAGWYTRPVTFVPAGIDATSGIESCERVTYGGPDDAAATVVARCKDVAGHVAARTFPLRYDATPPDLSTAAAATADRRVRLAWPAAAAAVVVRTPGLGGAASSPLAAEADGIVDVRVRNGVAYRYLVTLADAAGNSASRELVAVPGPRLVGPERQARISAPPLLRWTPVRRARYYNVQLFRGDRKILSAWPRRPRLQLRPSWRFDGRRHRLVAGVRYRWYVWPGIGPRADRRYGGRIGARSFVVG